MTSAAGGPGAAGAAAPRVFLADNAGPLTLDGTRTYLVGERRVAVIDPGPASEPHLAALAAAIGDDVPATILLTHGHADHAAGASALAARIHAPILAAADDTLPDGTAVDTDAGELVALATPGHTADHFAFHWPAAAAVFVGDLMTGGQDTALVAPPDGDLDAYLDSLACVRGVRPRTLYPAHGAPFEDAGAALDRYTEHRRRRREQVLDALRAGEAEPGGIVRRVYGGALDPALRSAAAGAVLAYLADLERAGLVRRTGGSWRLRALEDA